MKLSFFRFLFIAGLLLLKAPAAFTQQASPQTDSVAQLVAGFMKQANWKAVYALTDSVFRSKVPEGIFTGQMLQLQRTAFGNFHHIKYERRNGSVHYYKAYFDEGQVMLVLGCTELDSVNTFALRRYAVSGLDTSMRSDNPLRTEMDRKVDSIVRNWLRQSYHAGISIGVLQKGNRNYYGYGERVLGPGEIPGKHTLFEIGSISKTFTGILLARQYETGNLHPDSCISFWLPDSLVRMQWKGKTITATMLSNHTSGLPSLPLNFKSRKGYHEADPYKGYTDTLLYKYFTTFKPYREPGKNFEYSNMGVGLLGLLLQKQLRISYDEMVRKYITGPLEMPSTGQYPKRIYNVEATTPYNGVGELTQNWTFDAAFAAAGALHSTAADMLTYANYVMKPGNDLLGAAVKRSLMPTHIMAPGRQIGLGWMLVQMQQKEYITHSGGTGGYRSTLMMHVPSGTAVVVLTNTANEVEQVALQLLNYLTNGK